MGNLINSIGSADAANDLVSELIRHFPSSHLIDAKQVLAENPELRDYDSAVLGLAYEQFCRQVEAGEDVDPLEFAAEFPSQQQSLLRMLQVHKQLNVDDALLDAKPLKWPEAGEHFLGLDLIEPLGQGAFSRVFLASEPEIGDRFVVAKICRTGALEAHALGRLQHSNIVRVINVRRDELSGLSVVYMPYLGRATLMEVVQQAFSKQRPNCGKRLFEVVDKLNRMDARIETIGEDPKSRRRFERAPFIDFAIEIAAQLAEALEYTHSRGLCHCDVKPSNVLLTSGGRAMLFDFNLAAENQIQSDEIRGTIPYMSPEQLECIVKPEAPISRQVTPACDIFALGVTVYQLLSGRLPFGAVAKDAENRELARILLQKQMSGPLPLSKVNPDVNDSLSDLVTRCLASEAIGRPATAGEVAKELRRELAARRKVERWIKSRRRFVFGCAAASTAAVGAAGVVWLAWEPFEMRETRLGHIAYRAGEYEHAVGHYSQILTKTPNDVNLLFWRGRANLKSENYKQAIADFHKANEHLPVCDGRLTACIAYCRCRQAADLRFNPNDVGGVDWEKLYRSALATNLLAIQQGYNSGAAYHNCAVCLCEVGKRRQAIEYLKQAILRDDVTRATYVLLAVLDYSDALTQNVAPNVEYIEMVQGPFDPALNYQAARIFAEILAHQTDQETNTVHLINRTIAICRGLPSFEVNELGERSELLRTNPEFIKLANKDDKPTRVKHSRIDWFDALDPLGGIEEPLCIVPLQVN